MVDDLLDVSRFDAGSAELSLDEVDPGELVRRAVAAAVPVPPNGPRPPPATRSRSVAAWTGCGCRWTSAGSSGSWPTWSRSNFQLYAGGVTRVLVDAEPGPGRPGPDGTELPATAIRVLVEDNGPGVPEDQRQHLFERFYRGGRAGRDRDSSRGPGGSDSRWSPSTCGCTVVTSGAKNAVGRGTRFVVELPLHPADADGSDGSDGSANGEGVL